MGVLPRLIRRGLPGEVDNAGAAADELLGVCVPIPEVVPEDIRPEGVHALGVVALEPHEPDGHTQTGRVPPGRVRRARNSGNVYRAWRRPGACEYEGLGVF